MARDVANNVGTVEMPGFMQSYFADRDLRTLALPRSRVQRARRASEEDLKEVLRQLGRPADFPEYSGSVLPLGIVFVELDQTCPETKALTALPPMLAYRARMIPFRRIENTLYVAFADLAECARVEAWAESIGLKVVPLLAYPDAIDRAIYRFYPPETLDA